MASRRDKNQLIMVHADSPNHFRYRSFDGRDARRHLVGRGFKVNWIVYRAARPVGYVIQFKRDSPFVTGETVIAVSGGGLSRQLQISPSAFGRTFPYTVSIPSLGWVEDPEIRVGEEADTLNESLAVIASVEYFQPGGLTGGDWVYFRTMHQDAPVESFSIQFPVEKVPFENSGATIESVSEGTTAAYRLSPLSSAVPELFSYRLIVPSLGIDDPGGVLTVNPDEDGSRASAE